MADPRTYRPKTGDIPTEPGVYRFRDRDGRVIYVGKAKNLRSRLSNYFQDLRLLHPRHRVYIVPRSARDVLVGASEIESEDRSPVSLRSAVELMAAAHSVMPALAEARILRMDRNLRPALPDHRPVIDTRDGLLRTQLRAMLRASGYGPLRILLPMISGREEVRAARALMDEVAAELRARPPLARLDIAQLMAEGNAGQARIPGKHGGAPKAFAQLTVLVDDKPGKLGELFSAVGETGINLDDLRLEHSLGRRVGLAEISVDPNRRDELVEALEQRGWKVVQ